MTLHFYMARRFAWSFLLVLAAFTALLALLDLMEQVRRFSDTSATFGDMVRLTLLSTPQSVYAILPLIALVATMTLFLSLARSSELVVTRAAGRSGLRALIAPAVTLALFGALAVAALNPIVAATGKAYEVQTAELKDETNSVLSIGANNLWLRQGTPDQQTVIRAERSDLDGTTLFNVTFVTLDGSGEPFRRINAAEARLTDGQWILTGAKSWALGREINSEASAVIEPTTTVETDLTIERIRDSFGVPSSIAIWDLPGFIDELENAGFSARRHLVWFQMEMAQPAFWIAMLLIGAGFTMRHSRGGGTGQRVLFAILLGFGLFFVRNFAQILGESGQMPVLLAAWAPPVAAIALSVGLLLHLEDG
ncbi:LPS export ABC transporter permease LptG [Shimia ponticola]|uniref:LPS export ABC transporter permease LptG n=1 Tax=Shimia ponticola TaxID=2582893 RepID=UPI0011BDDF03|nr:LPS export ABC transporter permease LptG [Shimia ponticola]